MTDFFAMLDEQRRPWLEPETLKQKFLKRSTAIHPDRIGSASDAEKADAAKTFAGLNTAYQTLLNPKSRLLHLLELESGARPKEIQSIPAGLADLFAEVATACKKTDGFLVEKKKNLSPLVAVQWFERSQDELERLDELQKKLNLFREQLDESLKGLDKRWMSLPPAEKHQQLPKLEELYRLFSYFNRWGGQIQERRLQLAL